MASIPVDIQAKLNELRPHIPFLERVISKLEQKSSGDQTANLQRLKDMHEYLTNKDPRGMNINVLNTFDGVIKVILKTAVKSNPNESEKMETPFSGINRQSSEKSFKDSQAYQQRSEHSKHSMTESAQRHRREEDKRRQDEKHHREKGNPHHRSGSTEHNSSHGRSGSSHGDHIKDDHKRSDYSRHYRHGDGDHNDHRRTKYSSSHNKYKSSYDSHDKRRDSDERRPHSSHKGEKISHKNEDSIFKPSSISGFEKSTTRCEPTKKSLLDLPMPPIYSSSAQDERMQNWHQMERKMDTCRIEERTPTKESYKFQDSNIRRETGSFQSSFSSNTKSIGSFPHHTSASTSFSYNSRRKSDVGRMYNPISASPASPSLRPDVPLPSYPNLNDTLDTPQSPEIDDASFSPATNEDDTPVKTIPLEKKSEAKDLGTIINNTSPVDMAAIQQALKTINSKENLKKNDSQKVPLCFEDFINPQSSNSEPWKSSGFPAKSPFGGMDLDLRTKGDVDLRQIPGQFVQRSLSDSFSSNVQDPSSAVKYAGQPRSLQASFPGTSFPQKEIESKDIDMRSIMSSLGAPQTKFSPKTTLPPKAPLLPKPVPPPAPNFKELLKNRASKIEGGAFEKSKPDPTVTDLKRDHSHSLEPSKVEHISTESTRPAFHSSFKTDSSQSKQFDHKAVSDQLVQGNLSDKQSLLSSEDHPTRPVSSFFSQPPPSTSTSTNAHFSKAPLQAKDKFAHFSSKGIHEVHNVDNKHEGGKFLASHPSASKMETAPKRDAPLPVSKADNVRHQPLLHHAGSSQANKQRDWQNTSYDDERSESVRSRVAHNQERLFKLGHKGVAASQMESYKQKREKLSSSPGFAFAKRSSGTSTPHSDGSEERKSKPNEAFSLLDNLLPDTSEDENSSAVISDSSGLSSDYRPSISRTLHSKDGDQLKNSFPPYAQLEKGSSKVPEHPSSNRGVGMHLTNPHMKPNAPFNPQANEGTPFDLKTSSKYLSHDVPSHHNLPRDPRNKTALLQNPRDPRLADPGWGQKKGHLETSVRRDPRLGFSEVPKDPRMSSQQSIHHKDPRFSKVRDPSHSLPPSQSAFHPSQPYDRRPESAIKPSLSRPGHAPPNHFNSGYPNFQQNQAGSHHAPITQQQVPPPQIPKDSLIGNTFTCLMMSGLPPYANSSHIYRFFQDYILRDMCIELDHTYNCKGLAYIHFPNHTSAKEALEKQHCKPIKNYFISLRICSVGILRRAKKEYDVLNYEREKCLNIPPKPKGNGNPFYKPKPKEIPQPPPPVTKRPSPDVPASATKPTIIDKSENTSPEIEAKGGYSQLCGVKLDPVSNKGLHSFKIPKIKTPVHKDESETLTTSGLDNEIEEGISGVSHSDCIKSDKEIDESLSKNSSLDIHEASQNDPDSDSDELVDIIPTSKKNRRFRKIIAVIESDSDSDSESKKAQPTTTDPTSKVVKESDSESEKSVTDTADESMIIDESFASDSNYSEDIHIKEKKIKNSNLYTKKGTLDKRRKAFRKSMTKIDPLDKKYPVREGKMPPLSAPRGRPSKGAKRGKRVDRYMKDSSYNPLFSKQQVEPSKTTRQKSTLNEENLLKERLKVIIPVPIKIGYSLVDEKSLPRGRRKPALDLAEVSLGGKIGDKLSPLISSQEEINLGMKSPSSSLLRHSEEPTDLDETILFSDQDEAECANKSIALVSDAPSPLGPKKRAISRGRGRKPKKAKHDTESPTQLPCNEAHVESSKRPISIDDTDDEISKKPKLEVCDDKDANQPKEIEIGKTKSQNSEIKDSVNTTEDVFKNTSIPKSENAVIENTSNKPKDANIPQNIDDSKTKDIVNSVFDNTPNDDGDELSDLTQITPTISSKEFFIYDALPDVGVYSKETSEAPHSKKDSCFPVHFDDRASIDEDYEEKRIKMINDELQATAEIFNQQNSTPDTSKEVNSKNVSDDDDDFSLKVDEIVESLGHSLDNPLPSALVGDSKITSDNSLSQADSSKDTSAAENIDTIKVSPQENDPSEGIHLPSHLVSQNENKTLGNRESSLAFEKADCAVTTNSNLEQIVPLKSAIEQPHSTTEEVLKPPLVLSPKKVSDSSGHHNENSNLDAASLGSPSNQQSLSKSDAGTESLKSQSEFTRGPSEELYPKPMVLDSYQAENVPVSSCSDMFREDASRKALQNSESASGNSSEIPFEIPLQGEIAEIVGHAVSPESQTMAAIDQFLNIPLDQNIPELNQGKNKTTNLDLSSEPQKSTEQVSQEKEEKSTSSKDVLEINSLQGNTRDSNFSKNSSIADEMHSCSNIGDISEKMPMCIMENDEKSKSPDLPVEDFISYEDKGHGGASMTSGQAEDYSQKESEITDEFPNGNDDNEDNISESARSSEMDITTFPDDESVVSNDGSELKTPDSSSSSSGKKGKKERAPSIPLIERRRITRGSMVVPQVSEEILWDDGGVVDLFLCDQCDYVGRQRVSHLVNFHSEREVPCEFRKEDFNPVLRDPLGPPPNRKKTKPKANLDWIPKMMLFDEEMECQEKNCGYYSSSRFDFIYHLLDHKPQYAYNIYHCRLCNFMSEKLEEFYDHVTSHTGEYRHTCKRCWQKTFSLESLNLHHKDYHKAQTQEFESQQMVLEDDWPYIHVCKHCLYVQIKYENCKSHLNAKHGGKGEILKANMSRHISLRGEKKKDEANARKFKKKPQPPKKEGTMAPEKKIEGSTQKIKKGKALKKNNPVFEGQEHYKKTEEQEKQAEQLVNRLSKNLYTKRSVTKMKKNIVNLCHILKKVDDNGEESDEDIQEEERKTDHLEEDSDMLGKQGEGVESSELSTLKETEKLVETSISQNSVIASEKQREVAFLDGDSSSKTEDCDSTLVLKDSDAKMETAQEPMIIDKEANLDTTTATLDCGKMEIGNSSETPKLVPQLGSLISRLRNKLVPSDEETPRKEVPKPLPPITDENSDDDDDSDSNLVICEDEPSEDMDNEAAASANSSFPGKLRIRPPHELMSQGGDISSMHKSSLPSATNEESDPLALPSPPLIRDQDKQPDDSEADNFLRIESYGTLDPKAASQMFKNDESLPNANQGKTSPQSLFKTAISQYQGTPSFSSPQISAGGVNFVSNMPQSAIGKGNLSPRVPSQAESPRASTESIPPNLENAIKMTIGSKEPVRVDMPSASALPDEVPGLDTLPPNPPTVPILQTFSKFQDSKAFSMYTVSKACEVFKCMNRSCIFATDDAEVFKSHLVSLHPSVELRCCYCLVKIMNPITLIQHILLEHSHCQFQCKYCLYRAFSKVYMGVHLRKFHPSKESRYVKGSTIRSMPPPSPPIDQFVHPYKCTFEHCSFRTVDADAFHNHVNGHGHDIKLACFICDIPADINSLIKHMHDHMMNEFQCPYCLFGEAEREKLLTHLLNCHPGRPGKVLLRKQVPSNPATRTQPHCAPQQSTTAAASTSKAISKTPPAPLVSSQSLVSSSFAPPVSKVPAVSSSQEPLKKVPQAVSLHRPSLPLPATSLLSHTSLPSSPVINPSVPTLDYLKDDKATTSATSSQVSMEVTFNKISTLASKETAIQHAIKSGEGKDSKNLWSSPQDSPTGEKSGLLGNLLYRCGNEKCVYSCPTQVLLKEHLQVCDFSRDSPLLRCYHCAKHFRHLSALLDHIKVHGPKRYFCGMEGCDYRCTMPHYFKNHMKQIHKTTTYKVVAKDFTNKDPETQEYLIYPKDAVINVREPHKKRKNEFAIEDINKIPKNHILYHDIKCYHCMYSTKIRLNLIKHLNLHQRHPNGIPVKDSEDAALKSIPAKQPTNPVPRLERKELMFDKMMNLAGSNFETKKNLEQSDLRLKYPIPQDELESIPKFVPDEKVNSCGIQGCNYVSCDEIMLKYHIKSLHSEVTVFSCPHCPNTSLSIEKMSAHFKLHGGKLYRCGWCSYLCCRRALVDRHIKDKHPNKKPFDFIIRDQEESAESEEKASDQSEAEVKSLPNQEPQWQCGICPYRSVTQQDMVNHASLKHDNKSQYKCGYCHVRSSVRTAFDTHFAAKHPNSPFRVLCMYYRLDSDDIEPLPPPTSHEPIWKRNDPDKRKQIRGILIENEADKALALLDIEPGYPKDDEFVCPKCHSFKTPCVNTFRSHLCKEANYQRYECVTCALTSPLLQSIRRHITKTHETEFTSHSYITLPIEGHLEAWVESIISHQQQLIDRWADGEAQRMSIASPTIPASARISPSTSRRNSSQSSDYQTSLEEPEAQSSVMLQNRFTCNICGIECKTGSGLKSHTTAMHQAKFKCQYCPFSSNTELGIKHHTSLKHPSLVTQVDDDKETLPKSLLQPAPKSGPPEAASDPAAVPIELSSKNRGRREQPDKAPKTKDAGELPSGHSFRNYMCDYCRKRFRRIKDCKRHSTYKHPNQPVRYSFKPLIQEDDQTSDTELEASFEDSLSVASSAGNSNSSTISAPPKEEALLAPKETKEELSGKYTCCHCNKKGNLASIEDHVKVLHRELPFLVRKEADKVLSLEVFRFYCDHCNAESVSFLEAMDHWMKNHVTEIFKFSVKLFTSSVIKDSGVVESAKPSTLAEAKSESSLASASATNTTVDCLPHPDSSHSENLKEKVPEPETVVLDSTDEWTEDAGINLVSSSTSEKEMVCKCGYCRKISNSKAEILEHLEKVHGGKPIKCQTYERDEYDKIFKGTFECLYCGKSGSSSEMYKHSVASHPGQAVKVKKIPLKDKGTFHFRCEVCNHILKKKQSMLLHMRKLHPENPNGYTSFKSSAPTDTSAQNQFKCNYCGDVGFSLDEMDNHHTFLHSHLPPSYTNTVDGSIVALPRQHDSGSASGSPSHHSPVASTSSNSTKYEPFAPKVSSSPKNTARKTFAVAAAATTCKKKQIATKSTSGKLQLLRKRSPVKEQSTSDESDNGAPKAGGYSFYKKKSPSPDVSDIYARVNLLGGAPTPLSVSQLSALVNLKPDLVLNSVKSDEETDSQI